MISFNYKGIYYLIVINQILFVECVDNCITIFLKHDLSSGDNEIFLSFDNDKDCMIYLELIKNKLLENESGFTL